MFALAVVIWIGARDIGSEHIQNLEHAALLDPRNVEILHGLAHKATSCSGSFPTWLLCWIGYWLSLPLIRVDACSERCGRF